MAIDLFCYTSLDPRGAKAALEQVKASRKFDYERDFIPSAAVDADEVAQEIAAAFTEIPPASLFLVRLSNKSLLDRQTMAQLVAELKSKFPDLLVLFENEHRL